MLSLIPPMLSLVLVVLAAAPASAASEPAQAPPLRSSLPPTVAAPRAHEARPVRVTEPDAGRSTPRGSDKAGDEKVNINTADVRTLMTLSGVSRKVAQKIVEYRDAHGPFRRAAELRKVDGVGDGVFEKNRKRIVTK